MSAVPVASLLAEVVVVAETTATTSAEAAASRTAAAAPSGTATATTTAARTATAAATTRFTLFGNVHADSATVELLAIHLLHRGLGRIPFGERHEAKTSGTPRLSVGDHFGFDDFSEGRKSIA